MDGSVVSDLGDMTYEETVLRMVRLMFVAHQKRWVDTSLRNLLGDWLRRVEERFAGVNGVGNKPSVLLIFSSLDDPLPFVEMFFANYPLAAEQLLAPEDRAYFLAISQRPGQKPVPFIPVLDASFEVWFKKVCSLICEKSSSCHFFLIPSKFTDRAKSYVGFALGDRRYRRGVRSGSSTCVYFARPGCGKMVRRKG